MTQRWPVAGLVAISALLLGGCGAEDPPVYPLAERESVGELRIQAQRQLDRYAAAGGRVSPPSLDPASPPGGLPIDGVAGTPDSHRLVVAFTGAQAQATEPCGIDYLAEAVESRQAIVVLLVEQPHAAGEICAMAGFPRMATVNLAQPLGDRVVLDLREGAPVPLDRD